MIRACMRKLKCLPLKTLQNLLFEGINLTPVNLPGLTVTVGTIIFHPFTSGMEIYELWLLSRIVNKQAGSQAAQE